MFNLAKRGHCNTGVCVCVSAAPYHTITSLNVGRLIIFFIWRYPGMIYIYI